MRRPKPLNVVVPLVFASEPLSMPETVPCVGQVLTDQCRTTAGSDKALQLLRQSRATCRAIHQVDSRTCHRAQVKRVRTSTPH